MTPVADDRVGIALLTSAPRPFDDQLAAFPELRERAAGHDLPARSAGPGRCWQRTRRRVAGRVLLVGDAAGYVDALTGEGVALGLAQARAAVGAHRRRRPRTLREGVAPDHPSLPAADGLAAGRRQVGPGPAAARPSRGQAAPAVRGHRQRARPAGMTAATERVVLLDEDGYDIGAAAKAEVHHRATPLHLAFSCYLFDDDGRGADQPACRCTSATWPGAWTNSFCGHPGPTEDFVEAVRRRAGQELGVELLGLKLVLPAFRYRPRCPTDQENEMCPVFTAPSLRTRRRRP